MKTIRISPVAFALAALGTLSACGGSAPTAPEAPAAVSAGTARFDGGTTTPSDTTTVESRGGVGTLGSGN